MPSERPRMPGETYKSMLSHGSAKGLGLQAGEVAWYPKINKKRAIGQIEKIVYVTLALGALISLATVALRMG